MRTRRDPLENLNTVHFEPNQTSALMQRIIERGGLYAAAATYYLGDEEKSRQFITECFEQCHHHSAQQLWGDHLLADIVRFRLELLRSEFAGVMKRQHREIRSSRFTGNEYLVKNRM